MTDVIDLEHTSDLPEGRDDGPRSRQIADWGVDDTFRSRERSRRRAAAQREADARADEDARRFAREPGPAEYDEADVDGRYSDGAAYGDDRYPDDRYVEDEGAERYEAERYATGRERGLPADDLGDEIDGEPVDPFDDRDRLVEPRGGASRRREREVEDWFGDAPMPTSGRGHRFRRAEDWSADAEPRRRAAAEPDDDHDDLAGYDDAEIGAPRPREPDPRAETAGARRRRASDADPDGDTGRDSRRRRASDTDPDGDTSRARGRRASDADADGDSRRGGKRRRAEAARGGDAGGRRGRRSEPRGGRKRAADEPRPRAPRGPSAEELWSAGTASGKAPAAPRWTRPSLSLAARPAPADPAAAARPRVVQQVAVEPALEHEYLDAAGRRTVVVRGQPIGVEAAGAAALIRREPVALDRAQRGIAHPERLAAWAVGLGFLLVLIAVSTANAATI